MWLRRGIWILIGFTFLLIVWGGMVRRSGSGLGCPDWPLCYGQAVPPMESAAWIEFTHRLLAGLVGLLTLGLTVVTWCKTALRQRFGWWMLVAMFLVIAQALLGGVTVKTELHPLIVAAHLALAFLFFGVVMVLSPRCARGPAGSIMINGGWCRSGDPHERQQPQAMPRMGVTDDRTRQPLNEPVRGEGLTAGSAMVRFLGGLAVLVLFTQILIGGLVSGYQAGLACPDFPTCQGQWWPPFVGLVAIQMSHRIGAIITLFLVGGFLIAAIRHPAFRLLRGHLWGTVFLLALQIALGIGNVLWSLPFAVDVAHLAIAVALFGALVVAVTHDRTRAEMS
ncbi:MAG: COX15/CtaA family protein [Deltaproteobacteria bacterium]|nr:COX15/CtaA family protein [Deltaproteobacteria bacterium]